MPNPWRYPPDLNLSAFEPHRVYLNRGDLRFWDVTLLSGAGSEADGRGAMVGDFDGDFAPDILARNIGGGAVQLFLNRLPKASRLTVSLRGTKSNARGIGARVVVEAGGRTLVRQLYPANNYTCQQASRVRFGLGDAKTIDRITVHWPSGTVTRRTNVAVDQHLTIEEQ